MQSNSDIHQQSSQPSDKDTEIVDQCLENASDGKPRSEPLKSELGVASDTFSDRFSEAFIDEVLPSLLDRSGTKKLDVSKIFDLFMNLSGANDTITKFKQTVSERETENRPTKFERETENRPTKFERETEKERLKKIHAGTPSPGTEFECDTFLGTSTEFVKLGDEAFRSLVRDGHLVLGKENNQVHLVKLEHFNRDLGFVVEGKTHPLGTRRHDYFFVVTKFSDSLSHTVVRGDRVTLTKKQAKHVALAAILDGYRPLCL